MVLGAPGLAGSLRPSAGSAPDLSHVGATAHASSHALAQIAPLRRAEMDLPTHGRISFHACSRSEPPSDRAQGAAGACGGAAPSPGTRHPPTLWLRWRSCFGAQFLRKPKSFSQPGAGANGAVGSSVSEPRVRAKRRFLDLPVGARCIPALPLPIYGSSGCANPLRSSAHRRFLQCSGCRPRMGACPQAPLAKRSSRSVKQRAGGVSLHLPTTSL